MFVLIGVAFLLLVIFVFYSESLSKKKSEAFAKERLDLQNKETKERKDRHMQSLKDMDKERRIK